MSNHDTSRLSIAVVGVAALFPGSAESDGFWKNIINGQDLMSDVPASHWLIEDYYDPNPAMPGKTYARRGAFLPQVPFDPLEYSIPPHNLPTTDTVQLLSLIVAQRLLFDVYGKDLGRMPKADTSVILGATTATELITTMSGSLQNPVWSKALRRSGLSEDQIRAICDDVESSYATWTENTFPGLLNNVVAGRIASRFDLGGMNCVVDAACASSLGAIQMAVQSLVLGQSDLVITGGVDAFNDIFTYMCFSKTPALSRSEICRPFSLNADGTMIGEGIGMFALRRLADAERDENKIYAVVRGIGASSDGRAKSIYAPRPEGQAKALRRAYEAAGYGPETVELLEAHGTGTVAGDTAEFSALKTVFTEAKQEQNTWCALGSVKSQIGHTKGAAGAASFYKAVMAVHHGVLPPTINVQEPNPDLGINDSPFYLNTATRPWIRNESHPRRASLSSFGFGGTNFHVAIEEYKGSGLRPKRIRTIPTELFLLSADDPAELESAMEELVEGIESAKGFSLEAQESQKGFQTSARYRLSVVAKNPADLKMQLSSFLSAFKQDPNREFSSPVGTDYAVGNAIEGQTCFLFPGQGSQYVNMGADLAMNFERSSEICSVLSTMILPGRGKLAQIVYPAPVFSEEERAIQTEGMKATDCAQPAIAVVSRMLIDLLTVAGLQADVAAGHSFGELTALFYAGVLNERDFFEVARQRGLLSAEAGRKSASGMIAVVGSPEEIESTKKFVDGEITIANDNSPEQLVYCGPLDRIEELAARLAKDDIKAHLLKVDAAFHSRFVGSAVEPFQQYLQTVPFSSPQIPVYANTTALPYSDDMNEGRKIFASQLAEQVRFREQTENLYQAGVRVFIEVGPGNALSGLVGQCLKGRPHLAIPTDVRKQNGITSLWRALGRLAIAGRPVDLSFAWEEYDVTAIQPEHGGRPTVSVNGANFGKPSPPVSSKPTPSNYVPAIREKVTTSTSSEEIRTPSAISERRVSSDHTITPPPSHLIPSEQIDSVPLPRAHHDQDASIEMLLQMKQHSTEIILKAQRALIDAQIGFFKTSEIAFGSLIGSSPTPSHLAMENAVPSINGKSYLNSVSRQATVQSVTNVPPPSVADLSNSGIKAIESMTLYPKSGGLDFKQLLYQVVAEKTGYPEDILTLEMELEADLGIDSIKRIDILSALQERVPGLSGSETSKLGILQTLGAILAHLTSTVEFQSQPKFSASPSSPLSSETAQDLMQLLYQVVAEKTGYPKEILTLEMGLEADLGIDSIKRIDILSALQERVPGISESDTSKLGTLQTLGAILNYLTPANETQVKPGASLLFAPTVKVSLPAQDLKQLLYQVVAEKTGYPEDILTLDMGLEADLGIDSIKRIDILSALQERVPGISESDTSKLGILQTLGAILAHLTPAPSTVVSTNGAISRSHGPHSNQVLRTGLQLVPATPPGRATPGLLTAQMVAIVSKDIAIAEQLATSLKSQGVRAISANAVPPEADGVIVLAGFGRFDGLDDLIDEARRTFLIANAFAPRAGKEGALFVAIYDSGDELDLTERAGLGGIVGLTKTATLEWPQAVVRAIDITCTDRPMQTLIKILVDELLTGGDEKEIKLRSNGSRVTVDSIPLPVRVSPSKQKTTIERPFLVVSGGGHGITADCLVQLAQNESIRVLLLGRTVLEMEPADTKNILDPADLQSVILEAARRQGGAISPRQLDRKVRAIQATREIRRTLDRLVANGSDVQYEAVDILDHRTLTQKIEGMRRVWGPVQGIIHGAGVSWPKLIESIDETQFDAVFQIKIKGLQNLLSATANDPLRSIFLFSSVAGRYGNSGQADYAMANETLSKIARAEARKRDGSCCVRALIWGPWEGGLVTPAIARLFRERGVTLLPIQQGAELFALEWEDQRCDVEQSEVILMADSSLGIMNPVPGELAYV